jgi:hypothetical protein
MRLRAIVGISYPDSSSLKIVQKAGGLSKLTDEQQAKVTIKNVNPGGYCDDIPEASRKNFLKFGYIKEVDSVATKPKRGTAKR